MLPIWGNNEERLGGLRFRGPLNFGSPGRFFFMYLLYLDDSGSVKNKDEQYLVLGGISVFERQTHWLSQELEQLAARFDSLSPNEVEFHASEIFSRRVSPWDGLTREDARQTILDVLSVLARAHDGVRAFACAVHKASFPQADPMEIAFEQLCSRFDLQLRRFYNAGDPQRGIIILDESSQYETTLIRLARDFRSLGTRWNVLRNIAEIPLFVESHVCRLVQLADHVAYAVFRYYNANDLTYFNVIGNRFDADQGRLHGLVHMQSVNPQCLCPACMSRRLTPRPESRPPQDLSNQ